jgi:DhnA family fructose-bisphosphate aldolase class Ia
VSTGHQVRMARLVDSAGPTFILPIDDGLISGPNGSLADPRGLVRSAVAGGARCVLGYPGTLRQCAGCLAGAGYVQNLTASTRLSRHTEKVLVARPLDALRNGADGVAVHINFSASSEPAMLRNVGQVAEECRNVDVPLLVIAYPRRDAEGGDDNYRDLRESDPDEYTDLISHCARAAAELGAAIVKVPYTGSTATFKRVVTAALGTHVIVAGGEPVDDERAIQVAQDAVLAGGAGVAYGRQTFMRDASEVETFVDRVVTAMRDAAERTTRPSLAADTG